VAGLIDITEQLCLAVARRDENEAKRLALAAAVKMGAPRGTRIERAFEARRQMEPVRLAAPLKHWEPVEEPRIPWAPASVVAAVERWLTEAKHAEALALAGERVMPMLMAGETGCGKTSMLCAVAARLGLMVLRLSVPTVLGSHLGETANNVRSAFREMKATTLAALWLIDEVDGIAGKRYGSDGAEQERATGVNTLLTEMDGLPLGIMLAATTNRTGDMSKAVLRRFMLVNYPAWKSLEPVEQLAFSSSHGHSADAPAASYADAVQRARNVRVEAVLRKVAQPVEAQLELQGGA
jgi:hypothetical protein